jgi:HK97 family phage major capsid protein
MLLRVQTKSQAAADKHRRLTARDKAALALSELTSGGGVLSAENAAKFIVLMIEQSVMLKDFRMVSMKAPIHNVDTTWFPNGILKAGNEATQLSSADAAKPDLGRNVITAKTFRAELPLYDEILEDNIEGANFLATLQASMADAIARDFEKILLKANIAGSDGPEYRLFDGLFTLTTTNTVNFADARISIDGMENILKKMPANFVDERRLKYYTSRHAVTELRGLYADRLTNGGDAYLVENKPIFFEGIPVVPVQCFPENIGTSNHCTNIMLLDPKNFAVGIHRKLQMESDKNIRTGVLYVVATLRAGCTVVEETALVKGYNVNRS